MTKEEKLEILNNSCEYNKHNEIKVVDIDDGYCLVESELRPESLNPWGTAHGGFIFSMCDVATGVAACQLDRRGVTLSGNLYYLRPSTGKKLRAEGKVVKNGKTVVLVEVNVFNDEDVHTARGEFQLFITQDHR